MEQYALPHGGEKMVTYFLAVYSHQAIQADPTQVRQARLLPFEEAMEALAFPGAKRVLREAEDWLNARYPQHR